MRGSMFCCSAHQCLDLNQWTALLSGYAAETLDGQRDDCGYYDTRRGGIGEVTTRLVSEIQIFNAISVIAGQN